MGKGLWLRVGLFVAIRIVLNTGIRMVYPFLPVFARGLGVNLEQMSLALTARSFTGLANPILAPISDQFGRRVGLLAGLGLFTVGALLPAFWPTYPAFFAAMLLTGIGLFTVTPAIQAFVGDSVPYARRGRVMAVTELGWSLSFILGIPLIGLLISRFGWRSPFPVLAGLGLASMVAVYFMVPGHVRSDARVSSAQRLRMVLSSRTVLAGLAMGAAITGANEVVNVVYGVWMESSFGLNVLALGAASAVIGLSELGGEGLTAGLVDRLGKERAVRLGLVLNALSALALPLLGRSLAGGLVGLFFFYLTFEFALVSSLPLISELLPAARATVLGVNVAAFNLGRALAALAAPWLYGFSIWGNTLAAVLLDLVAILLLASVIVGEREQGDG